MYRSILQARSTQTKRGKVTETNQEWLLSEEIGTRNNVLVRRAPEQSRDMGTLSGARRSFFIWVLRPCICPSLADFQSSDFIAGVRPRPVPESGRCLSSGRQMRIPRDPLGPARSKRPGFSDRAIFLRSRSDGLWSCSISCYSKRNLGSG